MKNLYKFKLTLLVLVGIPMYSFAQDPNQIPSDARLKKDITSLSGSYTKIRNLEGIHFRWNKLTTYDTVAIQTGLIAQEVEKMFPELIIVDKHGYKSIDYIGLIPHLIEAIKVLEVKNEKLEETILLDDDPTERIMKLEDRLRILENQLNGRPSKTKKPSLSRAKSRGN